jgi:hypothetical protein
MSFTKLKYGAIRSCKKYVGAMQSKLKISLGVCPLPAINSML